MTPPTKRAYTARTVIAAQRRVLKLALNTIGRMTSRDLLKLRVCGEGGLITLNELSEQIVAALHLQIKKGSLR